MLGPAGESVVLDHAAIASRIPHHGRMCLLDRVLHWDERGIRCAALSHLDADNPLREAGGLPIWAGIEYAAQAAAVHGALLNRRSEPRAGVLAALRNINAACEWLDRVAGELTLTATVLHADRSGAIYDFAAHADDQLLLGGRFTLMFSTELQEDVK